MFASSGITEHLLRGAVGGGALLGGAALAPEHPWILAVALPLAVVALRGCPTCWTIGLVETIAAKVQGRPPPAACTDERCVIRRSSPRG